MVGRVEYITIWMLGFCGSVGYGRVSKAFYVRIARFRHVSVGMKG